MSLKEEIKNDLVEASKKQDEVARLVLRSFLAEVGKKEIELKKREEGLADDEVQAIVLSELKKRKEAKEQYQAGGRDDLAENEEKEAQVLQKYAPEQLSEEDVNNAIDAIIKEVNPSGMQDMGAVMKAVMEKLGNKADGSYVSRVVREKLSEL